MGCTYSTGRSHDRTSVIVDGDDDEQVITKKLSTQKINNAIDDKLHVIKQQENDKMKYLLLGTGESGKSTIFKQMRILHGSPMTDDELRVWGVVIRSNILTVVKQLCNLIRMLEVEDELNEEYNIAANINKKNDTAAQQRQRQRQQPEYYGGNSRKETRTPFKVLILHFAVYNANPRHFEVYDAKAPEPGGGGGVELLLSNDWVGHCQSAGLGPNRDAKVMLELAKPIKALWQVNSGAFLLFIQSHYNICSTCYNYILHVEANLLTN
jgi:hypothetical protein